MVSYPIAYLRLLFCDGEHKGFKNEELCLSFIKRSWYEFSLIKAMQYTNYTSRETWELNLIAQCLS